MSIKIDLDIKWLGTESVNLYHEDVLDHIFEEYYFEDTNKNKLQKLHE